MHRIIAAALGLGLGAFGLAGFGAIAQEAPAQAVVVELYTSQGCSSCPPADALLEELAGREDVIALALHVDYWDYIGWADSFADPAYTKRQKAYARVAGARSVYTPQMVVQGQEHLVGLRPAELADLIRTHGRRAAVTVVEMERKGGQLRITAKAPARAFARPVLVQLVLYTASEAVEIRHGENAGRRIIYANIVTDWKQLGEWDGRSALSMRVAAGTGPAVVIVQEPGPGAILASARLR